MIGPFLSGDPGLNGGIATFNGAGELLDVVDMPTTEGGPAGRRSICAPLVADVLAASHARVIIIESASTRPGEAARASFASGRGVGVLEGCAAALSIRVIFISPAHWKKLVGLPT